MPEELKNREEEQKDQLKQILQELGADEKLSKDGQQFIDAAVGLGLTSAGESSLRDLLRLKESRQILESQSVFMGHGYGPEQQGRDKAKIGKIDTFLDQFHK